MAHRSRALFWQCVEQDWGGTKFRKWVVYDGHPDDDDSEVIYEFDDKEYRKYIKGLPRFKAGEILTARMAFVPGQARRKKSGADKS